MYIFGYRHLAPSALAVLLLLPAIQMANADDPFAELEAATASGSTDAKPQNTEADDFEAYKKSHQGEFDDYKTKLMEEYAAYTRIAAEETERYSKELQQVWDTPELSGPKVWVDYSGDLKERNSVDFEKKTIAMSTVVDADDKGVSDERLGERLKALLTKNQAQAFSDDKIAQAIEKRSKAELTMLQTAEVEPEPILLPFVSDETEPSDEEVNAIVNDLVSKQSRKESTNQQGQKVVTIEVPLGSEAEEPDPIPEATPAPKAEPQSKPTPKASEPVQSTPQPKAVPAPRQMADARLNRLPKAARLLEGDVTTFANSAKMDTALVYAIIETESAFNPMAKSPVPAYGLMQIVPGSAGIDATEQLFGKGRVLAPSYLYTQDKNIEIGSTYLNILYYRYLKGVNDPLSRLYCSIAAYNTGAGNVAKAFIGTTRLGTALPKINAMTPEEVYDHLIENLPYEETRHYLQRVVSRMDKYRTTDGPLTGSLANAD
ncbi:transglycosylase SLT domain-containing protein [Allohahella marinimesophila]|uniref:Transglycosylase SLT domain-containing protein n=1 Tax=Allohahella marinimesophila TaxID=1054972 RepID=A0ABP7NI67_9GAMM